jgi:rubrerythrin
MNKKYVAGTMVNALLGKDEIAEFINQYSKYAKQADFQKYQELATYSAYKAKTESQQVKKFHTFMKDDLTAFNVDVLFTSEYTDDVSRITLYGCNFINNGQVMSVHDMISEYTMSFVAKDMRELHDLNDAVTSSFDNQEAARYETATRLLDGFKEFEEVIDNSIPDFGQIRIPSTESLNMSPGGKFSVAGNDQKIGGQKPIVNKEYSGNYDEDL